MGLEWDRDGMGGWQCPGCQALLLALLWARSAPPWLLLSPSVAARESTPSPSRDPLPAEGPLPAVKGRMKGLIRAPQTLHSLELVSAVTPQPQQSPWGAGRVGGRGHLPPLLPFVCSGLMETRLCSRERAWKPNPAAGVPPALQSCWLGFIWGENGTWVGIWGA